MKRIILLLLMFCYSFAFAGPSYNDYDFESIPNSLTSVPVSKLIQKTSTVSIISYQDSDPEFIALLPPRSPFKLLAMIGAVALIGCGVVTLRDNSYVSGVVSGAAAVVVGCTYVYLISINW